MIISRREKHLVAMKRWRERNTAWAKAKYREWELAHPEQCLFRAAKRRAKKQGREFTITLADIVIPETCPVFGIKLKPSRTGKHEKNPESPSLDRIDSTRGYTPDNVWVISWRANDLKKNATLDELRLLVKALTAKCS